MKKKLNIPKYSLIILPVYNIIVSDEEIKEGDLKYNLRLNSIWTHNREDKNIPNELKNVVSLDTKKVVASENTLHNLPSIDYNDLEEKYGVVDIEKLVEEYRYKTAGSLNHAFREGFADGFKKAQELNNKKFSLQDLEDVFDSGILYGEEKGMNKDEAFDTLIYSLKKTKVFDVKIEIDDRRQITSGDKGILEDNPNYMKPLITNNKIKLLK